jgi:tetratricopeptide (TPR) repeat protein
MSRDPAREAELRRRVNAGSQDPSEYRELAELLLSSERYDDAARVLGRMKDLPIPKLEKAWASWEVSSFFYEAAGDRQRALDVATDGLSYLEGEESSEALRLHGLLLGMVAHCHWFADQITGVEGARKALGFLERSIAQNPGLPENGIAYCEGARLLDLVGEPRRAIMFCESALRLGLDERDRLWCLTTLAHALRIEGRFGEAEYALREAFGCAQEKSVLPGLHFELALIQRATQRQADARGSFQRALAMVRNDPVLRSDLHFLTEIPWNLGELFYEAQDYEAALKEFQQVLLAHPDDDSYRRGALLWLGHCHLAAGSVAQAKQCYEAVLASPHASQEERDVAREGLEADPP